MAALRTDVRQEIGDLRTELGRDIRELRTTMTRFAIGLMVGFAGVIAATAVGG